MPRTVTIDGRDFRTVAEFFNAIGTALIPGKSWGKNLTAFNDILCWPLAQDKEPYVLVWKRSNLSRRRLNYGVRKVHWLETLRGHKIVKCQAEQIAMADRCEGPTAFDEIVGIIQEHPDWLSLRLE